MYALLFLCSVFFLYNIKLKINIMGRGDVKTKKGKIFKSSFGKTRPAKPSRVKKNAPAKPVVAEAEGEKE